MQGVPLMVTVPLVVLTLSAPFRTIVAIFGLLVVLLHLNGTGGYAKLRLDTALTL